MLTALVLFSQLTLADSLYARGYYEAARVEYARVFFFYPQIAQDPGSRLRYAITVLKQDEPKGISELNRLVSEFPALSMDLRREIATQYLSAGRPYLAIDLLRGTEEKYLLGMAYLFDDQYVNAHEAFLANGNLEIARLIEDYLQKPGKSEKTAALLSVFLPGAGETYAGNFQLAARDFLLNLGSGYLLYNAVKQQKYVDATLVFVFLINRFYLGSIYNAQRSALEHNEKQRRAFLDHLQEKFFGNLMVIDYYYIHSGLGSTLYLIQVGDSTIYGYEQLCSFGGDLIDRVKV